MKDLYFETLRERWRVLFRLSLLFAGPRTLFAAVRPLLMISHGSDTVGSMLDLIFFLWQYFLPFAAWHAMTVGSAEAASRIAFRHLRHVAGLFGLQAGIVFIALIPMTLISITVTVITSVTTGDAALATLWGMATLLLCIVIVMLTVEFRLLVTPVIVLRRGVKVGKAAECSNSIIGYHKKEVRPLYAFAVVVPRLMHAGAIITRQMGQGVPIVVDVVMSFLAPLSAAAVMIAAASTFADEIDTCPSVDNIGAEESIKGSENSE